MEAAPALRATEDRVGPKPWGWREALIAIGAAVFAYFAVGFTVVGVGLVAAIIIDAILLAAVYALTIRRYQLSWRALGFRPPGGDLWWVPPVAAFGLMVANGVYTVTMTALGADALAPDQEIDYLFDSRAILPLAGVYIVLVAPFAEEVFFRGFLFPAMIGRLGVWGAALASGLLFGAVHITNPDTVGLVIPIGAIGFVFAFIYYRTGTLWATIATHFLVNAAAFSFGVASVGAG